MFKRIRSNFIYRYISEILQIYSIKRGTILAKGIAYSFLITSIPLLFIAFYISTVFFSPTEEFQLLIRSRLAEIIPNQVAEYIVTYFFDMFHDRSWLKIGTIGIISLFIIPRGLFSSLENSLVTVMDSPNRRPILRRQFLYFLLIIVAICLFFFASYIYIVIKTLFAITQVPSRYYFLGSKVVSTFFISIALILIYRICYHETLKIPILMGVSFTVALIWQIINFLGASLITVSGKNELVYGVFASGFVFLVWAYIFAILLLLGGIIIARHNK